MSTLVCCGHVRTDIVPKIMYIILVIYTTLVITNTKLVIYIILRYGAVGVDARVLRARQDGAPRRPRRRRLPRRIRGPAPARGGAIGAAGRWGGARIEETRMSDPEKRTDSDKSTDSDKEARIRGLDR